MLRNRSNFVPTLKCDSSSPWRWHRFLLLFFKRLNIQQIKHFRINPFTVYHLLVWSCCIWVETSSQLFLLKWPTCPTSPTWFYVTTASKVSHHSSPGNCSSPPLFYWFTLISSQQRFVQLTLLTSGCLSVDSRLHSLRSLSLHNNLLTYLPREILSLVHLQELSLRGNPLVVRFVKEMTYDPPSLLELAGRTIKSRNIPYSPYDLPSNLLRYLDLASKCPNPKCAGKTLLVVNDCRR